MSRRASLPGADELFRSTGGSPSVEESTWEAQDAVGDGGSDPAGATQPQPTGAAGEQPAQPPIPVGRRPGRARGGERRSSGRERHDEKITVYVSAQELVELEHARLVLRAEHGLATDRGRIVREALTVVLADLEAKGEASILVRRLAGR